MKSCPTCNKTFTDPNLSFCIDDGTPLVSIAEPADETTVVSPALGDGESIQPPPTQAYKPRDWQAPDYQPPGFETSTSAPTRKKQWPWVVGVLAVLGIGVIVIGIGGILVYKVVRPDSMRRTSDPRIENRSDPNSNLKSSAPISNASAPGSNSNNENSAPEEEDDATLPPSDKDAVLSSLTDLEHEWTVANINADKAKLNRILADDYVGIFDGKSQGKAEYLRTLERTAIQNWTFEDLNVDVMRDRASLAGVLRLQLGDQDAAFKFRDRFVWRDGRWQAVSSEASQIK